MSGGVQKNDWDIAIILGISRSTVLNHFRSAREQPMQ